MALANLVANLNLNIRGFTNGLNTVRRQAQRFSSLMNDANSTASADRLISGYNRLDRQLHKVGLGFRDIARIASGITISQTFYGITRSIQDATSALWSFNESLDYAQITYSALFNNSELSSDFLDTVKQFSVDTIFEYTDIEGMARKLSAYGIEYQNLMYIIEGLTNLGTISGDSAALERLAVALGQINAKGILKAEEVRQLANAYVPIYDILRDKLGVTEEGFKSIGDLGISSTDAINAIIEYANETFGSVGDAAMYTITGLNNKIVDTLKVMGADIMMPITTFYKSLTSYISTSLGNIYKIYQESGLGGVFEHLVPNEAWQQRIRQLLANLSNFVSVFVAGLRAAWPFISTLIAGIIDSFNMLLSAVNFVGSAINGAFSGILSNVPFLELLTKVLVTAASAWVLFKAKALGAAAIAGLSAVFTKVAAAVLFLVRALTAHPIISMFVLLGAALIGISANANNADNAISRLMKSLSSYSHGGKTADDILQVSDAAETGAANSEQFWENMTDGAKDATDALDGAGDAAKKAAKDTKSLLSFDEVFKLSEPSSSGAGSGLGGALGDLEDLTNALGGLGGALIPEIPDLSDYAKNFVGTLYNDMWEALKTIASGGATGALIGGLVGFAIGGFVTKSMAGALTGAKWGAGIGGLVGAGFAGFWTDTYKQFEDKLQQIAVGAAAGTVIGGLAGLIIGAFATKTLAGAMTAAKWGAGIGGLIGVPLGRIFGDAEGTFKEKLESMLDGIADVSTTILFSSLAGMIMGAIVGGAAGGIGAVPGAIAGAKIGAASGLIAEALVSFLEASGIAQRMSEWFSGLGPKLMEALGKLGGNLIDGLSQGISQKFSDGKKWVQEHIFDPFVEAFTSLFGIHSPSTVMYAFGLNLIQGLLNGAIELWKRFLAWLGEKKQEVSEWFSGLDNDIAAWFMEKVSDVKDWWDKLWEAEKWNSAWSMINTWFSALTSSLSNWFTGTKESVKTWWSNLWTGWATGWSKVSAWFSALKTSVSTWFSGTKESVKTWWSNLWAGWSTGWSMVSTWFSTLKSSTSTWFTGIKGDIKSWWKGLFDTNSWSSAWSIISGWFSDLKTAISTWFSGLKTSVSTWWDNLWKDKTATVNSNVTGSPTGSIRLGHAKGGIFNREHIARFAEGNKAEAVIPLEDRSAMQPFVAAISDGILQGLLPAMVSNGGGNANNLPPMYVGTLIADERGMQELFKKFEVYEAKEMARKGQA